MSERAEPVDALVIGAGPAGLMAAEVLAEAGHRVVVAEGKPSPARKLLMAGKSGLNLTRNEPLDAFLAHYGGAEAELRPMLAAFGPEQVMHWAEGLGQGVFTGSTGRVFPEAMKASPLLRAWLLRLGQAGVEIRTRWRWTGWEEGAVAFDTPAGRRLIASPATVLALGGASWARLGSDGTWAAQLAAQGVPLAPFRPANVGLIVPWSPMMERHHGAPLKGIALSAGALRSRGEVVISARGLEGGGLYSVVAAVRDGAPLLMDLLPDITQAQVAERLGAARKGESLANRLRKAFRLSPAAIALIQEFGRPLPADPLALAGLLKHLPIRHDGLRPLDEAISTAGGVRWDGVDADLMLHALPGTYVAGEMLDWEAPTGGYLLTACFATGRHAGHAAARRL
ncbi:aminoacetone oxidase family FAD-binding enzyme [Haematobacter massiliensis]|uniref:NAD(FAD)-utilizing dehydrogenase n=1 Tax=Haematobacter massiliensis TaxID=195105 RepID=A0A086Y100_9RHOB|nr:TIGR03862 family flavoprotein [Haematobacter massiliensis]KFI27950.1 NAD(FAD)-utilizing dehydrogenase [Haematobacter massiliensis]OWJ70015.1 aminoacetone oxidase family FAD-binding enzyme [Haematobacter massiliensis]OWJ83365.1 aminoacetone oxidase family FAD-binding enzyme [Haematobacter massiliensis]QBJ23112.1 TIGR03862 family flavoprotein [Haematobacter massiliensis]